MTGEQRNVQLSQMDQGWLNSGGVASPQAQPANSHCSAASAYITSRRHRNSHIEECTINFKYFHVHDRREARGKSA